LFRHISSFLVAVNAANNRLAKGAKRSGATFASPS